MVTHVAKKKFMAEITADPMLPSVYYVDKFTKETHDTFTLALQPSDKDEEFSFRPGQFNMIYVFGVGEIPLSISGDPNSPGPVAHTTRVVGNVTHLMRHLKVGDAVGLRGPFGRHWPIDEAQGKDVVIVAGGIGLAPLRPALYQLLHHREKYHRVILLYGTRTPNDILYKRELKQWRSKFDLEVHVTVDRAVRTWRGPVGVVTSLISRAPFIEGNTIAMVCGPEVMMSFTVRSLRQRGLKNEHIFVSMERNMKCAVGFCGHCQYGPHFICKDGPVFCYDQVKHIFRIAEV
jgi:NAD(P)H-flavin reductase